MVVVNELYNRVYPDILKGCMLGGVDNTGSTML